MFQPAHSPEKAHPDCLWRRHPRQPQTTGATLLAAAREDLSEAETLLLAVRDQFVETLADRDLPALEPSSGANAHARKAQKHARMLYTTR